LVLQQITADNLLPEIRSLIGEEVGNIAKLATVILIEKKLGQVALFYIPIMIFIGTLGAF